MGSTALAPEYINANSMGALVPKMSIVTALATLLAASRIGLRIHRKRIGIDDWLIVFSVALLWASFATCVLTAKYGGLGRHLTALLETNPHALDNMELYFYMGDFVYATALAVVKCSILAMYWRIFPTRFIKTGTLFFFSLILAWWLGCVFVSIFQCKPIHKAWQPLVKGVCLDHNLIFMGKAVPNFTIDFLILCFPLFEIVKLRVRKAEKIALVVVFGLGVLACASSVVRFKIVYSTTTGASDITWVLPETFLWTVVEVSVAIMSACLPPLGPLLTWAMTHASFFRLGSGAQVDGEENLSPSNVPTIGGSGDRKRYIRDPNTLNFSVDYPDEVESAYHGHPTTDSRGNEASDLLPEGYRATQGSRVQGGASDRAQYIPMNRIAVTTEMSSREIRIER